MGLHKIQGSKGEDQLLQELHQAISELQDIEKGSLKARPATELLNEL